MEPEILESTENRPVGGELSTSARPLFVCGCQCSGTTAFADYLNEHERVLVCQERYKNVPAKAITRNLFTFKRILSNEPRKLPGSDRVGGEERSHEELLSKKDATKLKWVGDKNPGYVRQMKVLADNNPGARFVVLYRPVEEVAESFESRSRKPDKYPWFSQGYLSGFERGVELWNKSLRHTREFVESNALPRVLIVSYHSFFGDCKSYIPLLSRFLSVEFSDEMVESWKQNSKTFESRRRGKNTLSSAQKSFIREHADLESEAWIIDRIKRQWEGPGLYVEHSEEAALASLVEAESQAWRLKQQVKNLERNLRRIRESYGDRANQ